MIPNPTDLPNEWPITQIWALDQCTNFSSPRPLQTGCTQPHLLPPKGLKTQELFLPSNSTTKTPCTASAEITGRLAVAHMQLRSVGPGCDCLWPQHRAGSCICIYATRSRVLEAACEERLAWGPVSLCSGAIQPCLRTLI